MVNLSRVFGFRFRPGRLAQAVVSQFLEIDPTSWADQAKLAAEGRWKELDEFQDVLLGGRET